MSSKMLLIDNPSNLPLLPRSALQAFQGDLKHEPTPEALQKLCQSILNHHVFVSKAIYYENNVAYTEDGHQTLKAIDALIAQGYTSCEVIAYTLQEGRMVESGRQAYADIMIPCQVIVPQGDTPEARKQDAAAKLLQINSQYAIINPDTTWFQELGFDADDIPALLAAVELPGLDALLPDIPDVEFKEYDESIANDIEPCHCPTCGHEHARKTK